MTETDVLPSSDPQYGYAPDRRSIAAAAPPQTITPQSLQGKTVSVALPHALHSEVYYCQYKCDRHSHIELTPVCFLHVSGTLMRLLPMPWSLNDRTYSIDTYYCLKQDVNNGVIA